MALPSLQVDAFMSVARHKSFSSAARALNITQPALSQRILNLEQELGVALFTREPSGVRLTAMGHRLLRYGRIKENLEQEFLHELVSGDKSSLRGIARLSGTSTLVKSILIPALAEVTRRHPEVQVDVATRGLRELPTMLVSGHSDFVLTCAPIARQGIVCRLLGYEENVLVQSSRRKGREKVYLDHDEADATTLDFFKFQGRAMPSSSRREYFDDVYAILEGVRHGMGRAVIPRHILKRVEGVEAVAGFKPMRTGVYFSYFEQAHYPSLHSHLIEVLTVGVAKALSIN